MATTAMAQETVICDMCEVSPVQMHCNTCSFNLCDGCVSKHIATDVEKDHIMVVFKRKITKPVFPFCKSHKEQTCELKCQNCNIPVCLDCITSGSHKNHDFLGYLKLCNSQKDIIKQKTTQLETQTYPKYEQAIAELEIQLQNLPQTYDGLMSEISYQGEKWHQEVDIIIQKRKQEVEKMKTDDLATLRKLLEKMKSLLSTLHKAIMENNDNLQSSDVTKVLDSKYTSPETWDLPPGIEVTPPTFTPLPIQGEELNQMFGTLTAASVPCQPSSIKLVEDKLATAVKQLQLFDSPESPSSIHTGYKYQNSITCLSPDEIWVSGNSHQIKRFTMSGSLQKTVYTFAGFQPKGITITRQGNLIYTADNNTSINRVRRVKIEEIISLQQGWIPMRVCCTDSDELLITMWTSSTPSRVVRYSGSIEKQVVQFDDKGEPLFSSEYDLFIANNSDKDIICVSDTGANTVVVLNQEGKLRFRYTGNLSSQKYKSFSLCGVVIDSMGHILVADLKNDCIHIINQQGQFIRYIDNCQLNKPKDLSLDRNNTLYVAEYETAKVKVIKYLS